MDQHQNQKFADFLGLKQKLMPSKIEVFLRQAQSKGSSLSDVLAHEKVFDDKELLGLIAEFYHMPMVTLSEISIPDNVLKVIPYSVAAKQKLIAFERDGTLHVATAQPENRDILTFLEKKVGIPVTPFLASEEDIDEAINLYTTKAGKALGQIYESVMHERLPDDLNESAARILDTVITYAKQQKASDIHIEPRPSHIRVRYRIDGVLHDVMTLPKSIEELIVARVKVLANVRTDEHASAQDGRFKFFTDNQDFTIRVSILPVYDGEKVVMRLLTALERKIDLATLGYLPNSIEKIFRNYTKPHGLILVTGPTGSGKTTTLYSILVDLNTADVNITTLEDPVEYKLEGINQIQVNPRTNLTFAAGLRAILRQDPNVIMVGEIRDEETASIAINAALTGHLVLSTLHTNSAATTLPRLMEMGVEPFLVASTINLVVAQRLVRKLCSKCKITRVPTDEEKKLLGDEKFSGMLAFLGPGCELCAKTGYRGRTCLSEVLEITDEIRIAITKKSSPQEIQALALEQGMMMLLQDGLTKVKEGITSLAEVLRVSTE